MKTTFKNMQEALDAGFRTVNHRTDSDTSGPGSWGYAFQNPSGEETIGVYLSDEKNKGGKKGAVVPMYPPKE